jgi:putative transposase
MTSGTLCNGCTAHPDNTWITQQVRQVMWELDEREPAIHFLIRNYNKKFSHAFDMVFRSAGIHVITISHCAPNANALAERWIHSVREECLDLVLISNQAHLRSVMHEYVAFFNTARPHQGVNQQIPIPLVHRATSAPVNCRNVLGGIVHGYHSTLRRRESGHPSGFFALRARKRAGNHQPFTFTAPDYPPIYLRGRPKLGP